MLRYYENFVQILFAAGDSEEGFAGRVDEEHGPACGDFGEHRGGGELVLTSAGHGGVQQCEHTIRFDQRMQELEAVHSAKEGGDGDSGSLLLRPGSVPCFCMSWCGGYAA